MNDLRSYVKLIVEPTLDDFEQNPRSIRHSYLAAACLFHCVDRAARMRGKKPAVIRQEWRRKSEAFARVDVMAHDFKHVQATHRMQLAPLVARAPSLLGSFAFNTTALNDSGQTIALARLITIFEQALDFIRRENGLSD